LPADVITVAYGASCWTRIAHSATMVAEGFHGFLDVVRQGHPHAPIVVLSPIIRPDAEDVPNKLGASMADIRHAIESVARARIVAGDTTLTVVAGEAMITEDHLADGIHPGDEGHKRIAATVSKTLGTALRAQGEAPGIGALRDEAHRLDVQSRPLEMTDGHGIPSPAPKRSDLPLDTAEAIDGQLDGLSDDDLESLRTDELDDPGELDVDVAASSSL
jgi:hypothetical protein